MEHGMRLKSRKQKSIISTNSEVSPWFWLIAGPNGAGKSTWAELPPNRAMIGDIPILNPDHFIEPYTSLPVSPLTAGKHILQTINHLVDTQKSFAVETTLSGSHYLRLAHRLKASGWMMGVVFIGLKDENTCVTRVQERKESGGHDIPLEDILRRYQRSLNHIPILLEIADYMIVLDNSINYTHLLESTNAHMLTEKELPLWLSSVLTI